MLTYARVFALGIWAVPLLASLAFAQTPNWPTNGKWEDPALLYVTGYSEPIQAAHSVLLYNGRVLVWGYIDNNPNSCDAALFDPATGSAICVATHFGEPLGGDPNYSTHGHEWMCSGHAQIHDGSLVLFGTDHTVTNASSLYVPDANGGKGTIVQGKPEVWADPNQPPSAVERFYPTLTALPMVNGKSRVLITDGNPSPYGCTPVPKADTPTIVTIEADPNAWAFRPLYDARYAYTENPDPNSPNYLNQLDLPTYPFMFLTWDGNAFYSGASRCCATPLNRGIASRESSISPWKSGRLSRRAARRSSAGRPLCFRPM